MEKMPRIVCPVCGQEYLPSEIYLPKEFFGNPGDIIKTPEGKIDFFMGKDMDLHEQYTCDKCGTTFTIRAKVSFETSAANADSSKEESTQPTSLF